MKKQVKKPVKFLSLGKQKTLEKKSFVRPSLLFSFRFVVWGDGLSAIEVWAETEVMVAFHPA